MPHLIELAFLCEEDPHTPIRGGWVAKDGSGPRLRRLEVVYCRPHPGSATPAALQELEDLHLSCLRGCTALCAALPCFPGLRSLRVEQQQPYQDHEERLAAVIMLEAAARCDGLQSLDIGCHQAMLSLVELPPGGLSALTNLELEFVQGPQVPPPSWCSLPSLQALSFSDR
jgi:hypothetical protein